MRLCSSTCSCIKQAPAISRPVYHACLAEMGRFLLYIISVPGEWGWMYSGWLWWEGTPRLSVGVGCAFPVKAKEKRTVEASRGRCDCEVPASVAWNLFWKERHRGPFLPS